MKTQQKITNLDIRGLFLKFKTPMTAVMVGMMLMGAGIPSSEAAVTSFLGSSNNQTPAIAQDPSKAVARGYIVPTAQAIPGGAKIAVDLYQDRLNSAVSLWLEAAINDGKGNVQVIPVKLLSDNVSDNPVLFHSRREFNLSYDEMNAEIAKIAPNATNLKVGPGSALFVYAKFFTGHQWGGVDRGGIVFMPEDSNNTTVAKASDAATRRPTELDIAYPINQTLANQFNDPVTNAGLQTKNGQIRSRVETEGKFQIPNNDYDRVKKELLDLAADPVKAKALLGDEWTMAAEMRYMQKDPVTGQNILDATGLPIPDPMVDTYYDNDNYDAAKNDMAIRYRWTEGNQSGSWNYKPGMTRPSKTGMIDRIEYGVDSTDDKPGTIAKFADSFSPVNPFKLIRDVVPGSTPSDFLKPSVKVQDTRFKFKMTHKNGLIIEMSLDLVDATALRGSGKTTRYVQMEMDVEHLATQSANTAKSIGMLGHIDPTNAQYKPYLDGLKSEAFLDGRPVLHDLRDLEAGSPVRNTHQADFDLANKLVVALRDSVIGKDWVPGAQKYAFGAADLGLIQKNEASTSVKRIERLNSMRATAKASAAKASAPAAASGRICALSGSMFQ